MGPSEALAWDHPARTRLRLESSPAAERAAGELPAGTSSLSAAELRASALPGSLPRAAGFLAAPPARKCQHSWWLPNPLYSPSGTAGPSLPPAQAHPTRRTARGRRKAAILTFACPSISFSRLLAPNVLHWAREKEWKKVSSGASAARLEEQCWGTEPRPERHSRRGGGSAPSPGVWSMGDG